jgi:hypothetical protein
MICPHGLLEENCPHCQMQMRTRPLIKLVRPAPTELPLPTIFPNKHEEAEEIDNGLIQSNTAIANFPKQLTRKMNLRESLFDDEQSPLTQRQITAEQMESTNNVHAEMPLFDIKRKFMQK